MKNLALKSLVVVITFLLAIANLHGQIPEFGKEPTGEPDVHYYPFYDGVQMVELDYLSAYQRQVGYLEQAKPRALTYEMILGPPKPNVYVFRDRSGKTVKQYGLLPADIDLLPVSASLAEIKTHNNFMARLGGSHILSPFATRYFPYYLTGIRSQNHNMPGHLGLIDILGNRVLDEAYTAITKDRNSDIFITIKGDIYELRDKHLNIQFKSNKVRLQPSLQNQGYVDACENEKWGLLDGNGNWVVPAKYDNLIYSFNMYGLAQVRRNGLIGFVDRSGEEIIRCQYQGVSEYSNELLGVRIDGKWGFIDTTGKMLIKPQYTLISKFTEDRARVAKKIDGVYYFGYINTQGEELIPLKYANATHFFDGKAMVRTDFPSSPSQLRVPHTKQDQKNCKGNWITIDREGKEIR